MFISEVREWLAIQIPQFTYFMAMILIANVIVGAILGFVWRWHMVGLLFTAAIIGTIAVVIGGDWSEFHLLFSSVAAFVWIGFKYCVFSAS